MTEYIEREKAIQFVLDACNECLDTCAEFDWIVLDCNQCMLDGVHRRLRATPAADVREVKRGKWKLATYSGKFGSAKGKWYDQFLDGAFWYCGNCKERAAKKTNFCPNCGADMREKS